MVKVLQIIQSLGTSIRFKNKDGVLAPHAFLIVDIDTKLKQVAIDNAINECNVLLESEGKSMRLSQCDPKINPKTKLLYPPAIFVGKPNSMSQDDLSALIS